MKNIKNPKSIIILIIISLALTLCTGYLLRGIIPLISKDYIEFLIGLSITMAGFGLVAFQIGKASDELKKDFIESSILMILSSLTGIAYWIYPKLIIYAKASSLFFLWGLVLLLTVLLNERFNWIKQ